MRILGREEERRQAPFPARITTSQGQRGGIKQSREKGKRKERRFFKIGPIINSAMKDNHLLLLTTPAPFTAVQLNFNPQPSVTE